MANIVGKVTEALCTGVHKTAGLVGINTRSGGSLITTPVNGAVMEDAMFYTKKAIGSGTKKVLVAGAALAAVAGLAVLASGSRKAKTYKEQDVEVVPPMMAFNNASAEMGPADGHEAGKWQQMVMASRGMGGRAANPRMSVVPDEAVADLNARGLS
ncbi:MAG: hypothetical protein SFT92_00665 [Rickettsiales bacterium]|nr:hypothetical protein [Rickettsiales bacterium]